MPIDFSIDSSVAALRELVADFVREVAILAEPRDLPGHGLAEALRAELQDAARRAGIFAPQSGPSSVVWDSTIVARRSSSRRPATASSDRRRSTASSARCSR